MWPFRKKPEPKPEPKPVAVAPFIANSAVLNPSDPEKIEFIRWRLAHIKRFLETDGPLLDWAKKDHFRSEIAALEAQLHHAQIRSR